MKLLCQRCNPEETFEIPNFSSSEKEKIQKLHKQSPLLVVKEMINTHRTSHRNGKFVVMHLNETYKKCHRCQKELTADEYTNCDFCGSLNFNWK